MEHRWGERTQLDQPARLDLGVGLDAMARLRDASLSGGYVETDANVSLGSYLHLELKLADGNRTVRCRVAAYVVRRDVNGIGLEWCESEPRWIMLLLSSHFRTASAAEPINRSTRPPRFPEPHGTQ